MFLSCSRALRRRLMVVICQFRRRSAQTAFDPIGKILLTVADEAPEARIARPSPRQAVPFEGADRQTEDTCRRFWLRKKSMRVLPLVVGRTNKLLKFCGQGLASLAVTNSANSILRLISGTYAERRRIQSSLRISRILFRFQHQVIFGGLGLSASGILGGSLFRCHR